MSKLDIDRITDRIIIGENYLTNGFRGDIDAERRKYVLFFTKFCFLTVHMSKTLDFNGSQWFITVHNGSHPQLKNI